MEEVVMLVLKVLRYLELCQRIGNQSAVKTDVSSLFKLLYKK